MPTVKAALTGLVATLAQREEVHRFKASRERINANPEANRALHAFITECYTRARAAGPAGPTPADAQWLTAQHQAACRHPLVREYLDAQGPVLRLMQSIHLALREKVIQPGR